MRADFTFGVFELDRQARELRKHGVRVSVPDQSLEILILLLERPGEVVTREEIRRRLWPDGTVVEFDHGVNSAVMRLRERLNDSAATPRYIETLPRVGYRFLVQVDQGDGSVTPQHARLAAARRKSATHGPARRRAPAAALVAVVLMAGALGVGASVRARRARWAGTEALPEAARLVRESRPLAALRVLEKAERYAPPSAGLIRVKEALSLSKVSIHTDPAGAGISILDYADSEDRNASRWERLGDSPLEAGPIPAGDYRIRAEKAGFEPVERLWHVAGEGGAGIEMELHARQATPAGMVWVPGTVQGGFGDAVFPRLPAELAGFWLDRHEVTNRQYKEFVDAGGYQRREYWKQPVVKAGRALSWEEAMVEFRDPSGRPGPATWEFGTYPEGKAEYPVGGVSWYEASAYAEYAGKSLPTVYHWFRAAGLGVGTFFQVLRFSNFAGQGAAQAGAYRGLGPFGTFDMAGNVREWCWNPVGKFRYRLGGGWLDPEYQLSFPDAGDPAVRSAMHGFRCARYGASLPEALTGAVAFVVRDRRGDKPADEATFRNYRGLHAYDKTELKASVEASDESAPHWRREKVTFLAAYGGERVVTHLFLPRNAAPPYQVIAFMPGSTALVAPTVEAFGRGLRPCDLIIRSGRAVILPAYQGTLERGPGAYYHWLGQPNRWREMNLQWSKDLGRSLDYLETRQDVDMRKLAYVGHSMGGAVGPLLIAMEPRFKAAILISGGSFEKVPPEVDSWNFAPRVRIPVLMLNGRDDFLFPVEASQRPLLRLLGTPERDKKHVLYDGAHNILDNQDLAKEMLDWLDRYLGPVDQRR